MFADLGRLYSNESPGTSFIGSTSNSVQLVKAGFSKVNIQCQIVRNEAAVSGSTSCHSKILCECAYQE